VLNEALTTLEQLLPVAALRYSRWSYATVNATHIVGIAVLFGSIVPMDLRLMGWWRSVPIRTLARILIPVAIAGLILAVSAGFLLFSIRAVEYAGTTLFQVKMALVVWGRQCLAAATGDPVGGAANRSRRRAAASPAGGGRRFDPAVAVGDRLRSDDRVSGLAVTPSRARPESFRA
jgi:hypothetical protein